MEHFPIKALQIILTNISHSFGLRKFLLWGSVSIIALTYFILFSHDDLNHTAVSSYAILNGHINDFYEFNKTRVGGNDYLPLIYWVFAIWNYLFCNIFSCNLSSDTYILTFHELFAQKLLLIFLFILSVKIVNLIAREVTNSQGAIANTTVFYATSTVMLFCIFAFNQYDIVGMVFSLYGLLLYTRNKLFRFSILFSAAISIKYFALVAFFPILLIREKRFGRILFYSIIAFSVTAIQIYLYKDSPLFMARFYSLALNKIASNESASITSPGIFFFGAYILTLGACFICKPKDKQDSLRLCVAASIFCYLLLYLKVDWHPQWVCIILPYIALSMIYAKDTNLPLIFKVVFSTSFILLVISRYPNELDTAMLGWGFFRDYFGSSHIAIVSIYKYLPYGLIAKLFYISIFYYFLIALFSKNILLKNVNYRWQISVLWFSNLIFLFPALFIALAPPSVLMKFDDSAELRNRGILKIINKNVNGSYIENIAKGDELIEYIYTNKQNLTAVSLIFGTYNLPPDNKVEFIISNINGTVYFKLIDFKDVVPNTIINIKNLNIQDQCNNGCKISLKVISGERPLQLWHEVNKATPDNSYIFYNGDKITGTFLVEKFYKK